MKTELEWTILPRGTHTASFRHYRLDTWPVHRNGKTQWTWNVFNPHLNEYIGMGEESTEAAAKDAATTRARNKDHGA